MSDIDHAPTVVGPDGIRRPTWADRSAAAREYYDTEWGRPCRSESGILEILTLLGFAGGLTWSAVLGRREALADFFCGYDADRVAAFDDDDVARGLSAPGVIHNRGKIEAAVTNARATVAVRRQGGLATLVWGDTGPAPGHSSTGSSQTGAAIRPALPVTALPRADDASRALAETMRAHGFVRIGPVSAQALLLACGVVPVARGGSLSGADLGPTG